ncbi:MAG: DUF72 domain-containing protein [Deltaproteobacteria bacterium]|nr:DUF72 domain-containing protein [Deltaproteobacteria bacterium]
MDQIAPQAYIGTAGLGSDRRKLQKQLNFVELQQTLFFPITIKTATRWRNEAPEGFAFALRAWQLITHPPQGKGYPRLPKGHEVDLSQCGHFMDSLTVQDAYQQTKAVADALAAQAIVFETPASFTPTVEHRQRLTKFFETVERDAAQLLVWRPAGVWQDAEIKRICDDLKLVAATDPFEETLAADVGYLRLDAPRYSDDVLLRLADIVAQSARVYCPFNSLSMLRDAQRFRTLLVETLDG